MRVEAGFHDYLAQLERPLGRGAVVFRGRSGSGKSTYIAALLAAHPELEAAGPGRVRVVDELVRLRDLPRLARAMRRSRLVLAASHLPAAAHHLLWPLGPVRVHDLDGHPAKLARWLREREVDPGVSGDAALAAFCHRYGANYTDAAIVLERYPGLPFDRAFARFQRECRVALSPPRAGTEAGTAWDGRERSG